MIAAIAGAMAEGFYEIPKEYKWEVDNRIEQDMKPILRYYDKVVCSRKAI